MSAQFPLQLVHLFAGAGGGILGGILIGHTTVCAVEIEPYCAEKSCSNASETESCQSSPSGTMCEPLTGSPGEDSLTQSAPESLAQKFPALAKLCPVTRSWKTRQPLLTPDWEKSLETWPSWGLMLDGECWVVPMPAWTRTEKESGFLRRPQNKDGRGFYKVSMASTKKRAATKGRQTMLIHQLLLTAYEGMSFAVANPPFWESLMGWPIGWTDLQPLEMAKYQQWLLLHGKP